MAIEQLEHGADLSLRITATTVEQAFEQAAHGLFSLMLDVVTVQPRETYTFHLEAPGHEELLVEWLSDLLAQKELTGLVFSRFEVRIASIETGLGLDGKASGERLNPKSHSPKIEVKGISYLGLRVRGRRGRWMVQFVVDV